MTEQAETTETLTMNVKFHGGNTITLQQIAHGMKPQILIEMGPGDNEETVHFDINATGPEDQKDLAETLELLADALRLGTVTSNTNETHDEDADSEGDEDADYEGDD